MKKILAVLLAALLLLTLGCGSKNTAADDAEEDHAALDLSQPLKPPTSFEGKRVLVAFFSRAGENHEVGYVEKGNTALLAEHLAELIHADATFEIQTVIPYPIDLKEMTEVAKQEQAKQARPLLASKVDDMAQYDIIYLGYPTWYQDLPMPIYTFLESYDFAGKVIIPFSTGSGNAMSGKEVDIPNYAKGAEVLPGMCIRGKTVRDDATETKQRLAVWLEGLGYHN